MKPLFCATALLSVLWAHSVRAAGSPDTWRSPTTLDVVLVTFEDETAANPMTPRSCGGARCDYHNHDLPYGYNANREPSNSSYLLRDFERLFVGGYDDMGNYDAGTVFVGDTVTVANYDLPQEVFGSVRAYYDSLSNGAFVLNVRMINPTDEDGYPRWIELPETKAHYAEISIYSRNSEDLWDDAYATAMDSVRCWNPTPFPADPDPPTCGRNSAVTGYAITDIGPDNSVAQRRRHKVVYLYSGATFKQRDPPGLLHPQVDRITWENVALPALVGYRYVMGEREGWGSNDHDVDEFAPVFTHAHEIGHLLGFNHGEGRWIGPNPYSPHDQSRPRETYTNARKGNLLEWGLMQGDGAGPEVMDNGYHGVYRSCPNPLNPFYRRDLGWITPTPVTGSQDNFEIEPGTVHLIDRTTHEYLLERRAHDGPRFHNSGIRINGINGISFGRYLLFHEYEDEDPGLFIWRRETQIAGAEERPILIVADERRIADARDQDQNPNTPQYQDMRFDPFPGLGNVSAVDALTPDMGLRQATQGILDRNGMPTSIGEQVDPGEVGLALTNITRTEVAGRADRLTVDVIFRPSAPSNLTVAAGDGAATLRWDDPDDFTLDRWEYQQQGLSDWVEIPVDDDQLTRDEATGTLSYPVLSLTHGEMYSFEVRAHNAAGWGPAAGPVEVTLNTAPVVSGPETPSFDEDSEETVATYTATDAQEDGITWSLTGADAAAFSPPTEATGNSFDLSFRSAPNYETPTDANLDTVYEVTVVATDDGVPPLPGS